MALSGKARMNDVVHQPYLEFVLDLLGELDDVAHRKMMGEYVLYYRGKVIGGIYDDRFLLKVTPRLRTASARGPARHPLRGSEGDAPRRGGGSRRTARRRRRDVGGATCTEEEEQEVDAAPGSFMNRRGRGRVARMGVTQS